MFHKGRLTRLWLKVKKVRNSLTWFSHGATRLSMVPSAITYLEADRSILYDVSFLALPNVASQHGPVYTADFAVQIPESVRSWLLSGAPQIYNAQNLLTARIYTFLLLLSSTLRAKLQPPALFTFWAPSTARIWNPFQRPWPFTALLSTALKIASFMNKGNLCPPSYQNLQSSQFSCTWQHFSTLDLRE